MSLTIDNVGRKVLLEVENMSRLTRAGIEFASHRSGLDLINATSKEILRKPKGGRTYIRRDKAGRRRKHVASAPGETHANMTGKLRRSLGFKVGSNTLEFGYGVQQGDAPKYAGFVEFGTRRMEARPSLQNGIESQERNMILNLEREVGKRLGSSL